VLLAIFGLGLLATIGTCVLYFLSFHGPLSRNTADWAQFGDFVGGVLSATLTFLALIAVLLTLWVQREEIRAQVVEAEKIASETRHQVAVMAAQTEVQKLTSQIAVHTAIYQHLARAAFDQEHSGKGDAGSRYKSETKFKLDHLEQLIESLEQVQTNPEATAYRREGSSE